MIFFIINLQFKMIIVRICFVVNGITMMLSFISGMWNICLNGSFKSLFYSIDWLGTSYKFKNL